MLRLITLGRIELTDAQGRPVEEILKRPKRLALLAYLAAGGAGSMRSRDSVLGLFWPDQTQAKARQSLNQALYVLRSELGKDVVVSVGNDQVGLAAGAVWCDAVALRAAVASGDHRSAQAHYRGEFLPGFFLSDAPDFEKWLDGERATLRRLASSSAWKLAEESAAAGDVETAAAAAARSAELSLREEAAVRRAIELLDGLGERARALDLYRELESDLAEDLGTRPAPETQVVVARVRAREADPEVTEALAQAESRPPIADGRQAFAASRPAWKWQPEAEPAADEEAPRRRRMALLALPVVAIVGLIGLVWLVTRETDAAVARSTSDPHLLIEPFGAYAADDRLTDIAGAITEGLAARLAEVDAIEVLLVEPGGSPSADSAAIALAAPDTGSRAWFVVRGRVLRDGDRMRAVVSLIDRPTGQVIGSATIERVTQDPMGFVDIATRDAARFARAAMGRELRERIWRASTGDVEAWRLLERAEADRREAEELSEGGAAAAADAALAQADSLLARAESRDPEWTAPIILRAQVAHDRMWGALLPPILDRDLAQTRLLEGLEHAERALALDSTDARALEAHGLLLDWRLMLAMTPSDSAALLLERAERDLRAAVAADPQRAAAWKTLSSLLQHSGRYDQAYYAAQQAFRADAFLDGPHDILMKLFTGAFETGDDENARRYCIALREQFADSPSAPYCALTMLAYGDTLTGRVAEAWRILQSSEMEAVNPLLPALELLVARVLAYDGAADSARAVMARARARSPEDPELLPLEAAVYLALNQPDSASLLLRRFVDEEPTTRQGILSSRRFEALRE